MAVNYNTALKTSRMEAVLAAIDASVTAATLEIGTTSFTTLLAVIPFSATAGSVTGDTLTFTVPVSDADADASGDAAIARIKNGDGVVIVDGLTVGTTASNIILDNITISAGQTITLNAASIQHSA